MGHFVKGRYEPRDKITWVDYGNYNKRVSEKTTLDESICLPYGAYGTEEYQMDLSDYIKLNPKSNLVINQKLNAILDNYDKLMSLI